MGKGARPFFAHHFLSVFPAPALDSLSSFGKPRTNIVCNLQKSLDYEREAVQVQEKDKEQDEEHGQADRPKKRVIPFCPLNGRGTFRR
jgi:hypothetical protein